jgi:hypothetical protein
MALPVPRLCPPHRGRPRLRDLLAPPVLSSDMTPRQRIQCGVLAGMALFALLGTWSQNLAYFSGGAGIGGFGTFVVDAKVNAASRSLGVDIAVVFYAVSVFMVVEARKLGIRFVWAYVLLGLLIAISVTFSLFLIARELRLAAGARSDAPGEPGVPDVIGLGLLAAVTLGLCAFTLGIF